MVNDYSIEGTSVLTEETIGFKIRYHIVCRIILYRGMLLLFFPLNALIHSKSSRYEIFLGVLAILDLLISIIARKLKLRLLWGTIGLNIFQACFGLITISFSDTPLVAIFVGYCYIFTGGLIVVLLVIINSFVLDIPRYREEIKTPPFAKPEYKNYIDS